MVIIKFLEKPSERELLLSWREPARCNYTEQLWTLRKATSATTCVLTGEKIRRGDRVYSPAGRPANRSKCIRPEAVQLP